ncbi:MAG: hypothetical protein BTN85_1285 [Candidatus Methanohalarchaeum thermophilum]|uniref:Uncharacterized protein n=1 Tax=Methanohalarchaeum thermophilum TaxID=1903181 RepID=A0A1Q6DWV6_METT1|nr:MAG: hypothetical protein BTN85_1285 [Candidatus Methanohalarchaeum thermophilum]
MRFTSVNNITKLFQETNITKKEAKKYKREIKPSTEFNKKYNQIKNSLMSAITLEPIEFSTLEGKVLEDMVRKNGINTILGIRDLDIEKLIKDYVVGLKAIDISEIGLLKSNYVIIDLENLIEYFKRPKKLEV